MIPAFQVEISVIILIFLVAVLIVFKKMHGSPIFIPYLWVYTVFTWHSGAISSIMIASGFGIGILLGICIFNIKMHKFILNLLLFVMLAFFIWYAIFALSHLIFFTNDCALLIKPYEPCYPASGLAYSLLFKLGMLPSIVFTVIFLKLRPRIPDGVRLLIYCIILAILVFGWLW